MDLTFSHQRDEPSDKNGNSWGYIKNHGILSRYESIGIDSRGFSIFMDDSGTRQQALLDTNGSFDHGKLREGGWYHSDNAYEHIVNTAEEFGKWEYVETEYVDKIFERGLEGIDATADQELKPSTEAVERWDVRGDADMDVLEAWNESDEIDWPRENDPVDARYHPETGCTILRGGDALITVYPEPHRMDEKWLAEEILSQI